MHAEELDNELPRMTEAEYLAFADEQDIKYEYCDGVVYAMTGGTVRHGVITVNTSTHLNIALRESDCTVVSPDVRVFIAFKQRYRYPDVSVFCGDAAYREGRPDTLTNPVLLVEVQSPSTASVDHTEKLREYTRIESLQAYVLGYQHEPRVEVYQRHSAGQWLYTDAIGLDAEITVKLFDDTLQLSLAEIYRRVRWDEQDETPSDTSTETNDAE